MALHQPTNRDDLGARWARLSDDVRYLVFQHQPWLHHVTEEDADAQRDLFDEHLG